MTTHLPRVAFAVWRGYEETLTRPLGPTPAAAIAQLQPLIALGVRHVILGVRSQRTLERFATDVAPVVAPMAADV